MPDEDALILLPKGLEPLSLGLQVMPAELEEIYIDEGQTLR